MQHELLLMLKQKLSGILQLGMDHIIAPPFCAYCKKFLNQRTIFCMNCYDMIKPIVSVQLSITSQKKMTIMAVAAYDEPLKTLILAKSWSDILACSQLGQLMWEQTYFKHMPCDYLVPIPLHWMRFAKRGYNQAVEIAQYIAQHKKVTVADIIARTHNTPFQSSLAYDKRLENVKHVFSVRADDSEKYYNKHIVLVDDLMTTGSTLVAAAKVLLPLKPASINALVACRVV